MQNIVMNIFMMRNWRVKLISTSFHLTYPDAPGENRRNQIEPNTFANAIRRPLYSVYIPMIYNSKYYDSSSHSQRVLSLHITCGWGQIWMISDSIRFWWSRFFLEISRSTSFIENLKSIDSFITYLIIRSITHWLSIDTVCPQIQYISIDFLS